METKSKKNILQQMIFVLSFILFVMLFIPVIAKANMNYDSHALDNSISWDDILFLLFFYVVNAGIEVLFGYLIFFRKQSGSLAVLTANSISWPFFIGWIYITQAGYFAGGKLSLDMSPSQALLIGEAGVILLEALIIKKMLKEEATFKKAFFIALALNLITIAAYLLIGIIGSII